MASGIGDASMGGGTWDDLSRVLAELQASGSIHFHRTLARRSEQLGFSQCKQLTLPLRFIEEHGDKFEEWVIFRTRTSARPWIVQVSIFKEPDEVELVKFAEGWEEFAVDNCLKPGDSLIFVLKVPLPEFMVYVFRASGTTSSSARNWFSAYHSTRVSKQKVRSLSHGRREEQQKNVRVTGDSSVEKKKTVHEARRQLDLQESACDEEYGGQNLGDNLSENDTGNERDDLASQHGTDTFPLDHTSMARRTGDDLSKVLAELQTSGSIHFHKTLARRSKQLGFSQCKQLTLPSWFVEEHGDKFEEWVFLRTLSSAKPWRVHLGIRRRQDGRPQVLLKGGWKQFVAENRIEEDDSLVFALNVAARSEFRVYISRGVTSGITNMPPQHGTNCNPSFSKRIMRCNRKDGRLEVPASFVKSHGKRLQSESVKVQGVHQESDVRVVKLYWNKTRPRNQRRLYFQTGWRKFVNTNGLQDGQELQFTLIADSFFTVRVV